MSEPFDFLGWGWIPVLVAAFYLAVPLLIYFQQRLSPHPEMSVVDLAELEPDVKQFLAIQTDAVLRLGFDEPTLIHVAGAVPNVINYLIMMIDRQAGDKAMVTVIIGTGAVPMRTSYVEFSTRYDTGHLFDTCNSGELMAFPAGEKTVRTHVPSVQDPSKLYRLHKYVIGKHAPAGRKVVYEPGEVIDYLSRFAFKQSFEEQARRGWLRFDKRLDVYRPTFKGAYLMTWGLLQPMKAIRWKLLEKGNRPLYEEFERAEMLARR